MLARATRSRSVEGTVALGPNREALAERSSAPADPRHEGEGSSSSSSSSSVVVLVSGPLGLIYLPRSPERLTLEQIAEAHPKLLDALAAHPGIGFVMVRSQEQGTLVIGTGGHRRLSDDGVEGDDPLAHFDATVAGHLRRHDSFPHCPDLLVNSMYDPVADEVAPFEEFMGSHGGLGGPQTHPFAVIPAEWSDPVEPIVGVEAMHAQLSDWLAESRQARGMRSRS